MNPFVPEFVAEVYYLSENEKGWHQPIFNDAVCQLRFFDRAIDWSIINHFGNKEYVSPGETSKTYITFDIGRKFQQGRLYPSKTFLLRVGKRIIGKGEIISILREDYKYWSLEEELGRIIINKEPISPVSNLKKVENDLAKWFKKSDKVKSNISTKISNKGVVEIECRLKNEENTLSMHEFLDFWNSKHFDGDVKRKFNFFQEKTEFEFIIRNKGTIAGKIIISKT